MGNLYAESAMEPKNLQNSYEKVLGMTDDSYTAAVDSGSYTDFAKDSAGYGLAQWTYSTRKAALLAYAKAEGKSIGDLDVQLGFLMKELTESFSTSVLSVLKKATSVKEASDAVLTKFERPADMSDNVKTKRAGYCQTYYEKYATAASSNSTLKEETTMSKCYASAVIAVAVDEIGYYEKKSNSQLDSKTANAGSANYTKYAAFFDQECPNWYNGKKNGYAWCDMFVDYCFHKAFGHENALSLLCQPEKSAGAGCTYSAQYFRNKGQFYTSGPKPGDQIFFGTSVSNCTHTGIVEKVDSSKVYTIEGNTSDMVARRSYALGASNIVGYGRPKFDTEDSSAATQPSAGSSSSSSSTSTATKTVDELAKEVIDGKWGNGTDRKTRLTAAGYDYAAVQAKVNALLTGKSSTTEIKVGDIVKMIGTTHYTSSYVGAKGVSCKGGEAKVTAINKNGTHPYHLVHTGKGCTVYGWVNAGDVSK